MSNGVTALHVAAQNGRHDVVRLLLDKGAQVDTAMRGGFTPLHIAAKNGHLKIVKMLAITEFSKNHHIHINQTLLDNATPEIRSYLNEATLVQTEALLRASVQDVQIKASIINAIRQGADVNAAFPSNRITPLHYAVNHNNIPMVGYLIYKGADVNAQDSNGNTPLHIATLNTNAPMIFILLNHGANVSIMNHNQETPIHIAAQYNIEGLEMLTKTRRQQETHT